MITCLPTKLNGFGFVARRSSRVSLAPASKPDDRQLVFETGRRRTPLYAGPSQPFQATLSSNAKHRFQEIYFIRLSVRGWLT